MIELDGIHKSFRGREVLRGVRLDVARGRRTTILGPSGSGKTTLLRLIAGLESPDAGRIRINGREVFGRGRPVPPSQRGLAMIFQGLSLWPHMTVLDHLTFVQPVRTAKEPARRRTDRLLASVGLDHRRASYPHQLSGGEKQRLAIARALSSRPEVLLMDEPFSHLDFDLKMEMIGMIDTLWRERRMTVVCVTHQLGDALCWTDDVAWLAGGRIRESGPGETFRPRWRARLQRLQNRIGER